MAIVKQKINQLDGTIKIESESGKGTRMILSIPTALATIRGLIISAAGYQFAINVLRLKTVTRRKANEIKSIENKETILYNNKPISLVSLNSLLGLDAEPDHEGEFITIAIIKDGDETAGLIIDSIVNEQEILFKKFTKQIKKAVFFEGATLSSRGSVIPVLDVSDIFKALKKGASTSRTVKIEESADEKKDILVVDDSVTSRMLLQDILLSAGYNVDTAVDGKEAWSKLNSDSFDLLVSDIEMPRMNGFELTEKVRASEKLSSMPIVLITSLAKREHREKGIDAGANAYIVKSDFQQSNLFEIIKKFI